MRQSGVTAELPRLTAEIYSTLLPSRFTRNFLKINDRGTLYTSQNREAFLAQAPDAPLAKLIGGRRFAWFPEPERVRMQPSIRIKHLEV